MLHPVTALSIAAAVGSGFFLYAEKHHTAMLDRDIGRVIQATQVARERTSLLRSEWALLNDPDRLQELAGHYLALQPLAPSQFVQLADLHSHLPDPVSMPPGDDINSDTPAKDGPADLATTQRTPPPTAAPPVAVHAPPAPALSAPPKQVAAVAPKPHPTRHVSLAREEPPHDLIAPLPVAAGARPAIAHPMRGAAPPALVGARPSYVMASPYSTSYRASYAAASEASNARSTIATNTVPTVASALGGRPALPPPVPLGAYP